MSGRLALLIATISLLPTSVLAQYHGAPEPVDPGRSRLAFAAVYALRYTRVEDRTIQLPDGPVRGRFESQLASGIGASVLAEIVAAGALRGMASLTYLDRGETSERSASGVTNLVLPGSSFLLATAGIALRLAEQAPGMQVTRLNTAFRVGPTYTVEWSRRVAAGERERRAMGAWGVALGIEAEVPIGEAATFQLGAEDHYLRSNEAELARRLNEDFARTGVPAYAAVASPAAHVLMLRAGFAFTFR